MKLVCPRCGSKTNELIECENCGAIGCPICMRRKRGKWVCYKCEIPEVSSEEKEISNAFSAMFG